MGTVKGTENTVSNLNGQNTNNMNYSMQNNIPNSMQNNNVNYYQTTSTTNTTVIPTAPTANQALNYNNQFVVQGQPANQPAYQQNGFVEQKYESPTKANNYGATMATSNSSAA